MKKRQFRKKSPQKSPQRSRPETPDDLREACRVLRVRPADARRRAIALLKAHPLAYFTEYPFTPFTKPQEAAEFSAALDLALKAGFKARSREFFFELIPLDPTIPKLGLSRYAVLFGSTWVIAEEGSVPKGETAPSSDAPTAEQNLRRLGIRHYIRDSILGQHDLTQQIALELPRFRGRFPAFAQVGISGFIPCACAASQRHVGPPVSGSIVSSPERRQALNEAPSG